MSIRTLCLVLPLLLLCGCPQAKPGANSGDPDPAAFVPSAPIPADNPLLTYEKLKLGMNSVAIAQAYNAPEGKGEGFTRLIQDFGAASNHIIEFDTKPGTPTRRMVLRVYRDELCKLVDRREGLTAKAADEWLASLKKLYGEDCREVVPGAQWSWGSRETVLLTFTRDNASDKEMKANVVLVHQPSYDASLNYLQEYEKLHPANPAQPGAQPSGAADAAAPGSGA